MLLIAEYVVPVSSEPIEHGAVFIKDGAIADIGDAEMMRLRYPNEEVKDFGMEFFSDGRGGITYLGLSLFEAEGSAYTGNMLAAESVKSAAITACLPGGLLDSVRARIQQSLAVGIGGGLHRALRHRHDGGGGQCWQGLPFASLRRDKPEAHHGPCGAIAHPSRRKCRNDDENSSWK